MISPRIYVSLAVVLCIATLPAQAHAQQELFTCGTGTSGPCVQGTNSVGIGVVGASSATGAAEVGVEGFVDGSDNGGVGVWGASEWAGTGIKGTSNTGYGVSGSSASNNGVTGVTSAAGVSGVYGENDATSGTGYGVAGRASGAGVAVYGDNTSGSGWSGYFTGKVYAGSGYSSSDVRLKKNIKPLDSAIDQVLRLHGVTFEWREPETRGDGLQMGFIAQDVETVFPQWVTVDPKGYKAINTKGVEPLLVESVRVLHADNDALRVRVSGLEERLKQLEGGKKMIVSGLGDGSTGLGLVAMAAAIVISRRRRSVRE
jgi:hypothetical protein